MSKICCLGRLTKGFNKAAASKVVGLRQTVKGWRLHANPIDNNPVALAITAINYVLDKNQSFIKRNGFVSFQLLELRRALFSFLQLASSFSRAEI